MPTLGRLFTHAPRRAQAVSGRGRLPFPPVPRHESDSPARRALGSVLACRCCLATMHYHRHPAAFCALSHVTNPANTFHAARVFVAGYGVASPCFVDASADTTQVDAAFPDNRQGCHCVELLLRSRAPRIFFPLQLTTKRVDAKGPRTSAVLQPLRDPGVCLCALPGKA